MVYFVFDFIDLKVSGENTKKSPKIKEEPIVNSKKHSSMEIEERANMVERPEDTENLLRKIYAENVYAEFAT